MIIENLAACIELPRNGMTKAALLQANGARVMGFGFASGHELKEHTAPGDVLLQFLEGRADITIAGETSAVQAGSLVHIPANVPHSVHARTALRMLLTLL